MTAKMTGAEGSSEATGRGREGKPVDGGPVLVCVGASSSSIVALESFVRAFPPSPDWATILVLAHREAFDEARFRSGAGALRVEAVEDGAAPDVGRLYLCPPNAIVTVSNGRFQ